MNKTAQMDQPNKHLFFNKLHRSLAKKYLLSIESISFLRDQAIGQQKTIDQVIFILKDSIELKKRAIEVFNTDGIDGDSKRAKDFQNTLLYIQAQKDLLAFLQKCSLEEWEDITQKTDFDKSLDSV